MKRLTILATENKLVGKTIDIKFFLADLFVDLWYTWNTEGCRKHRIKCRYLL